MDRWKNKVAVVSGASSGIGAGISEKLVEHGMQVVGLARRIDKVQELAKKLQNKLGKLHPVECDVTKEEDILKAFKWTKDNLGTVHVLINNAGVAKAVNLIDGDTESFRRVLETNILGLTIATREAVQNMILNDISGHIIHINSICGHYVPILPHNNVYPASKHAVTALTETLRQELFKLDSKIKVTSISPGYVETEIAYKNGFTNNEEIAAMMKKAPKLYAEDIANAVVYALGTPPHVQVTELTIRPVGEAV